MHKPPSKQRENCAGQTPIRFIAKRPAGISGPMANPGETTAERLLAYTGVRRVPSPRIELFDRPHFLDPELYTRLIALID